MSNKGPQSIDEANTTNLFRAITHYHASIRRSWSEIETSFDDLIKMYVKPNNSRFEKQGENSIEIKPRFVYIYDPRSQPEFEKCLNRLSFELHGVFSVTTEMS